MSPWITNTLSKCDEVSVARVDRRRVIEGDDVRTRASCNLCESSGATADVENAFTFEIGRAPRRSSPKTIGGDGMARI